MALEITEEFATEHGLSAEQVTAVTGFVNPWHEEQVVELKGTYDGKANENAEAILNGAATKITEITSVSRNDGEKVADFMLRAWGNYSTSEKTALEEAKADYDKKLAEFDGDAGTKEALRLAEEKLDSLQQKTADYDDIVAYKDKYESLSTEHITMKEKVVFGNVKPNFPDTVDEYRAKAKWSEFMDNVKKDYDVELVDGESMAISKENKHKVVKLSELLSKDEEITTLLAGRQQNGTNGKPVQKKSIEGVPFDVPVDAKSSDINKLVMDYLLSKPDTANMMSQEYSKQYGELYNKIKGQQTA